MKLLIGLCGLFIATSAFAQTSPTSPSPTPTKPALIKSDAPVTPVVQGSVLRMGLQAACTRAIEMAAFNNPSFVRGKDVVPEETAIYRRDVANFVAFACPCVVDTLDKDVGLSSATPEKLALLRAKIGPAMQQTCSKDVYLAQLLE